MTSLVKEVCVRVERDAWAGVAEDATDLSDVHTEVNDQVAGECMAQVVRAEQRLTFVVQSCFLSSATKRAALDVSRPKRPGRAERGSPSASASTLSACQRTKL